MAAAAAMPLIANPVLAPGRTHMVDYRLIPGTQAMIHIFIGTKAQLIKMAPIMRVLQDRNIDYNFIFSGQHRDTVSDILANFRISKTPDVVLYDGPDITGIVQMGRWAWNIARVYGRAGRKAELFRDDTNGIVLNHGDTFSTLLGAWLAKRHGLQSAHIESGLRSHNLFHPFPEEITRLLTFRLSDWFFAPGQWALENLAPYKGHKIDTGYNTLCDALRHAEGQHHEIPPQPYGLVSIHRFENIFSRKRLGMIVDMLLESSPAQRKIFILHKPTEKKLRQYGLYAALENSGHIELWPRLDYFRFMALVRGSEYLVTDGGSNQEECSYLGLPCLLMRKATERLEGLGQNTVLSGYDREIVRDFMQNYRHWRKAPLELADSPSEIIVDALETFA
jgi:UDP-N-acetylglucosamine 2-epimerase (non-hydrolysing)